jgi:hypothetical protein
MTPGTEQKSTFNTYSKSNHAAPETFYLEPENTLSYRTSLPTEAHGPQ